MAGVETNRQRQKAKNKTHSIQEAGSEVSAQLTEMKNVRKSTCGMHKQFRERERERERDQTLVVSLAGFDLVCFKQKHLQN